ncbi:MAG TPA: DUF5658 family protein [Gammaproteobacteria bacterium]
MASTIKSSAPADGHGGGHVLPRPVYVRAAQGSIIPERRRGYDRRQRLLWSFVQGGLTPRRRGGRRAEDGQLHVDWHEPHLLFLALGILALSVADAFLTVTLLAHGAYEANPVMAYVLRDHPSLFAAAKMAFTGMGVTVLVALARATVFNLVRVSAVIHWCLAGYLALIAYEWWLLQALA